MEDSSCSNMDIRERLRKKLEVNKLKKEIETTPEEIVFDVIEGNLPVLDNAIRTCVLNNIALKPYSSTTFGHSKIPLTQIPGLTNLFQQACLNHGLLGYFDWVNENNPSPNNTLVMNNIITITCGSVTSNLGTESIEINQPKLNFLREKSREKFNLIISN